jgi:hypothetical protein
MKITVSAKGGGNFELTPEGNHIARCVNVLEIGTIEETTGKFAGKKNKKIRFVFELPNEKRIFKEGEPEEPFLIGIEFTASLSEKANLRRTLESWRGKKFTSEELENFDLIKVLGAPAQVNVIHAVSKSDPNKKYAQISSISQVMKGITCPPAIMEQFAFSFDPFSVAAFEKVPAWLRDKIRKSDEYRSLPADVRAKADVVKTEQQAGQETTDPAPSVEDSPF